VAPKAGELMSIYTQKWWDLYWELDRVLATAPRVEDQEAGARALKALNEEFRNILRERNERIAELLEGRPSPLKPREGDDE
jgi:hypothetical protein